MEGMTEGASETDAETAIEAGIMTAENPPAAKSEKSGRKQPEREKDRETVPKATLVYFLQVAFLCASILFVLSLLAGILMGKQRSKKKRRRKK